MKKTEIKAIINSSSYEELIMISNQKYKTSGLATPLAREAQRALYESSWDNYIRGERTPDVVWGDEEE